jgi:hypothetical protein
MKLIKSGSAEPQTGLCSEGSLADGKLPLCKLSPEVLGFKKKLNIKAGGNICKNLGLQNSIIFRIISL